MIKKNIILVLCLYCFATGIVFSAESHNELYYKRQIQNQRFAYGSSGLLNAIQKGRIDVVKMFINAGYNMNDTWAGYPIIFYALQEKEYEIFEIMLQAGANPNTIVAGKSLLHHSIYYKDSTLVNILIKNKADINLVSDKKTPLNFAITKKQTKIVDILLKAGAKLDTTTEALLQKSEDEYLKSLF